jgi:hypothetical protein
MTDQTIEQDQLGRVLGEALRLSMLDKVRLMERLAANLETEIAPPKARSILEFEGIAAHLADDEDPQEHLRRLRDEWDDRT